MPGCCAVLPVLSGTVGHEGADLWSDERAADAHLATRVARCTLSPHVCCTLHVACCIAACMLHAACLHVQMLSGNPPFSNLSNPMAILFKISRSTAPPPFPAGISSACADFLTLCFRLKPAERPSARELLEHRFLSFSDRESES